MISGTRESTQCIKNRDLQTETPLCFVLLNRKIAVTMGKGGYCNEIEFANI